MPKPFFSAQFKRDRKRMLRQGKDDSRLKRIVRSLAEGILLEPRNNDHSLSGDWCDFRECHIDPDWLLIYRMDDKNLYLARTGTHADLFKA
ncbi:MAG TPA: type II toxin-antitoxin system YafQ family toxin [Thermovirgaceae bacterium]|nr:type II toxin-antitoxin system YafQ family toxin [Thermovirgaceae bacterium]